jgi:subtilase family serine protease
MADLPGDDLMSFFRLRRIGCMLLALCTSIALPAGAQVLNQITKPIDASVRHTFANSVPVQVRAFADLGRAPSNLPMQDMMLQLQASPAQTAALTQFLQDVHNPNSPSYHQWLTPAQFGARFGTSDQDLQTVNTWLASNGFNVIATAKGKNWVRFTGSVAQVEQAFGTEVHQYSVAGKKRTSNAKALSVPDALSPVVTGLVSLNNFEKPAQHTNVGSVLRGQNGRLQRVAAKTPGGVNTDGGDSSLLVQPGFTSQGSPEEIYLAPGDFAKIYNTSSLVKAGTDGTGVSIALVGRSDISLSDVESFRTIFGLPFNDPTITYATTDPGVIPGDDEEAILDVEWSGAVAPKANINLVVGATTSTTDGVDISASYIVDNVTAPIMSLSFGLCEQELSGTELAFYNTLWQQASAEGITVFVSAGDAGSSDCDVPSEYLATSYDFGVNGLASTPYNVAVGGTEFNDTNVSTYWSPTINADMSSALGYVPEAVWNESCNPNLPVGPDNCYFSPTVEGTYATGGGASTCSQHPAGSAPNILTGLYSCSGGYAKPSWQTGPGVPADGARDLPDLSLAAAAEHDGFLVCYDGSCQYTTNSDGSITLQSATIIGGTSAASPSMAGIMALVEQKNGSFQGQANYKFYQLAAQQSASLNCDSSAATDPTQTNACVFHDITSGSNALSCLLRNKKNCSVSVAGNTSFGDLSGYSATAGYDQASGLGSVNAANLVSAWGSITTAPSTTTLTLSQTTFAHGTPINVASTVAPASGSGTPTGSIVLKASSTGPLDTGTLTSGAYTASVTDLPGGTYTLTSNYGGDSSYAASISSPVSLTVSPEASVATAETLAPSRFYILGRRPIVQVTSVALGTNYYIQVNIAGASGAGVPTGTVALSDGTKTFGTYPLSNQGEIYITCGPDTACDYPIGTVNFTASYSGDSSFNATTVALPTFNITKGTANYGVSVSTQTPAAGSTDIAYVYFSNDPAVPPTGTVTLTRGDTHAVLATGTIGADGVATIPFVAAQGTYFVMASWSGDANYTAGALSTYPEIITSGTGATASTTTMSSTVTTATLGQRSPFHITVTPAQTKAGAPTPTGTVTLYTPYGQAAYSVNLIGGTVTTYYEWDLAGPQTLYAVYSGDATYTGGNSAMTTVTVSKAAPTLSLTAVANYVAVGAKASVTGVLASALSSTGAVAPSGNIQFYDSVGGAAAQPIGTAQALNGGNGGSILATLAPTLPTGANTITAVYSGDTNWLSVTSNPVTINVTTPSFSDLVTPNPLTLGAGQTATLSIATQSILGFNGTVAVSCGGTLPVGISCTSTTLQAGASGSITLTSVAPGTAASAALEVPRRGWIAVPEGIGFAGLLLLMLPRSRRLRRLPLLSLILAAAFTGSVIGCGGSSSPKPTTVALTSSSTKAASGTAVTLYATVNAANTLTGNVTFYDGTTALGAAVPVTSGVAPLNISTLTVGTHALTAVYDGDSSNEKSSSSNVLDQTITGQFTLTVNATSGSISYPATVAATLQ